MSSIRVVGIAVCVLILGLATAGLCDVIHLKDGGKIEGKVISESEKEVRIVTKYGVQSIPRENIKDVEKTPPALEIYKQKLSEIKEGDAEGHYQLGLWCKEEGLTTQAGFQFREALKFDPGHHGARVEMGYVYYGGRWVHTDELKELMEKKNLVAHEGRLMSKEEYEKLTGTEEPEKIESEPEKDKPEEEAKPGAEETKPEGVPWHEAYDVSTSHYKIRTNVDKKTSKRYKKLMEEMHSEYRKAFKGYKPKTKGKYSVWIFRNQQDFMQETGRGQNVGGFYDAQTKRVSSYRGVFGSGTTDAVLALEGCHQYLDSIMTDMGTAPAWIVEGFAVYFESARASETGSVKMEKVPRDRLMELKSAISNNKFIRLDQLIRRSRSRFGRVEQAHAWSLIYFMTKTGGKYGKILSTFFEKCANYVPTGGGRSRSRVNLAAEFEKLIGDKQVFEDAWRRFISGLKVPPTGEIKGDTFKSDAMGFEITKPPDWTFVTEGGQPGFQIGATKKNSKFEVVVVANSSSQDAKTYASGKKATLSRSYSKVEQKELDIGGLKAAELVYSDETRRSGRRFGPGGNAPNTGTVNKYRVVVVTTADRVFIITFQAFASIYDADAPEFEQAVQSFKLSES